MTIVFSRLITRNQNGANWFLVTILMSSFNLTLMGAQDVTPVSPALPTLLDIEQHIEATTASPTLADAEKIQRNDLYRLAIRRIESAAQFRLQSTDYAEALLNAPAIQTKLEEQIKSFELKPLPKTISAQPLVEIQRRLSKEQASAVSLRNQLARLKNKIKEEQFFDLEKSLAEAREELAKSNAKQAIEGSVKDTTAKQIADMAGLSQQRAEVEMLEQRLFSRDVRLDLMRVQQDLISKQLSASESVFGKLQGIVKQHRQSAAIRIAEKARRHLAEIKDEPAYIIDLAKFNVEQAELLTQTVAQTDLILQQKAQVHRDTQQFEENHAGLTQQLEFARLGALPEFGAALRKQHDKLRDRRRYTHGIAEYERGISLNRLALFQIDEERLSDKIPGLAEILPDMEQRPVTEVKPGQLSFLSELADHRKLILDELASAYRTNIRESTALVTQQRLLERKAREYTELLDQYLLWMPTAKPVGAESLFALKASASWLVDAQQWHQAVTNILDRMARSTLALLLTTFVLFMILKNRRNLSDALEHMKDRVHKVNKDRYHITLMAVVATIILAFPGPLVLFFFAFLLDHQGVFGGGLANALGYGAAAYLLMAFLLQSTHPYGLAVLHFRWSQDNLDVIKANLPWFMAVLIPALIFSKLIETQGSDLIRDNLGRAVFLTASLASAAFAFQLLSPVRGIAWMRSTQWQWRYLLYPSVILLFLFLAGMSLYGYHYTAVQIEEKLFKSIALILMSVFLFFLVIRALAIRERKLALEHLRSQRAMAVEKNKNRQAALSAGEGVPDIIDLQEIDLRTISQQTRTLIRMMMIVFVSIALWTVWAELLPAFKPLEQVTLWESTHLVNGVPSPYAITLWNILLAILAGFVTFFAAKNVPGLLELTILSRMSLEQGTSYAFTTILRYFIVITGVVLTLQLVGAQWSKIQWLVAALGVGLGFGLQEIVANFAAGIVILFERPIRLGDTVTVGEQYGTVTRIRIRATTITDWDRKEVIIPNKTFITEKLINWTLTDPISREIIRVGVAYGSDIDLVEKTLVEIATQNEKILDDPPPAVFFLNFGDSCLDFEVRVFVNRVRDLVTMRHEMHVAIDKSFRQKNIEISFPQQDVHVNHPNPIEVRLINSDQTNNSK